MSNQMSVKCQILVVGHKNIPPDKKYRNNPAFLFDNFPIAPHIPENQNKHPEYSISAAIYFFAIKMGIDPKTFLLRRHIHIQEVIL